MKIFYSVICLSLSVFLCLPALANPQLLSDDAEILLFDHGGALDYASRTAHLGSVEVASDGTVYVLMNSTSLGALTSSNYLVSSQGMGTSQVMGPAYDVQVMPWAADMTLGSDGFLYVAGAMNGQGGIFGFDPNGVLPIRVFAQSNCAFSTSGLTFAEDFSYALVATDGSFTSCENGLFKVSTDGTTEQLIVRADVPQGIPFGTDDHTITLDGRIILAGDKSHELWDVTAGAGGVTIAVDLDDWFDADEISGWAGDNPVFGSRITTDPVTGDLFYSHGTGAPDKQMTLFRIKEDFSDVTIFADNFNILRGFDFGPVGENNERSLFVSVLHRAGAVPSGDDTGTIYEIRFFADQDADGVADINDNCLLLPNPPQRDTDQDGFGNLCDPDLDDNGIVNFMDFSVWSQSFNNTNPDADFDGDGAVNFLDLAILSQFFLLPPGPSGIDAGIETRIEITD